MEIVITQWALDSYLNLKHSKTFSRRDYENTIRPDVLLMKNYPTDPKFKNSKFFSFVTDDSKRRLSDGYKMKWHKIGSGRVQLRLPIGLFKRVHLCEAYPKTDPKFERRMIAKFKTHLQLIRENRFRDCGRLT